MIYDDTEEAVGEAKVIIRGYQKTGLSTPDKEVTYNEFTTEGNGAFFASLEENEEVRRYSVSVEIPNTTVTGVKCSPESCTSLDPGRKNKVTVRVLRDN